MMSFIWSLSFVLSLVRIFSVVSAAPNGSNRYGIDSISKDVPVSTDCFQKNGNISFAIVTGLVIDYNSGYRISSNVCSALKNAQSAGVVDREVVAFPDPNCGGTHNACDGFAQKQIDALMKEINTNCKSAFTGRIWIVVDNPEWWEDINITGGAKNNKQFFQDMITAASTYTTQIGVFSSSSYYKSIFGDVNYSYAKDHGAVVGYSSSSGKQTNFNDWNSVAFGGWSIPYFKRYDYASVSTGCSANIGLDYDEN
jgi:hypothetical protein